MWLGEERSDLHKLQAAKAELSALSAKDDISKSLMGGRSYEDVYAEELKKYDAILNKLRDNCIFPIAASVANAQPSLILRRYTSRATSRCRSYRERYICCVTQRPNICWSEERGSFTTIVKCFQGI